MTLFLRLLIGLFTAILLALPAAAPALAAPADSTTTTPSTPAAASTDDAARPQSGCSATFFRDDRRLGPAKLATTGIVGRELNGYRRTGNQSPDQFLATFWDPTAFSGAGGWRYPPQDGYLLDRNGQPLKQVQALRVGSQIDRYGSEFGSFLAPTGLAYSKRSIPPQSLVGTPPESCNYSNYRVAKSFRVYAGPIAPWFNQPGRGTQYQLDRTLLAEQPATLNVRWLIDNGYLQRI